MTAPFPFIVGCGRSGSTLLRSMLDAHPDLAVPPESYFLEQLVRRRDGFLSEGHFDRRSFEAELFRDPRFAVWGTPEEAVRAVFQACPPNDLADAMRGVYRAAADQVGASRYADKTPSYALCMPELARLLPEAVFVHLVRDPRDVAASYRRATWGPRTLTAAADAWVLRAGAAHRAGAELPSSRFLEVHYEDLVTDTRSVLVRICEFIELRFDERMLDHTTSLAARETAGRDSGAHTALMESPALRRDWRSELTEGEAARIGVVVDDLSRQFGYPPSPHCSWPNRVRLAGERMGSRVEATSLRFRRTRVANRLRGPWRRLRRRSTPTQIGVPTVRAASTESVAP